MTTPQVRSPAQQPPHDCALASLQVRSGPRREPQRLLASLVGLFVLLMLFNCVGNVGSGNTTGGAGGGSASNGGGASVTPGANGGLGTVAIVNMPRKAISRLTNAQILHSAAALLGNAGVVGADALLPEQQLQGGFRNSGFGQELPLDLVKGFDAAAAYVVAHVTDWPSLYQRYAPCIVGTQVMTAEIGRAHV